MSVQDFRNKAAENLQDEVRYKSFAVKHHNLAKEHLKKSEKELAKELLIQKHRQLSLAAKKAEVAQIHTSAADHLEQSNNVSTLLSQRMDDPGLRRRVRERKRKRIENLKNENGVVENDKQSPCFTPCEQKKWCDKAWGEVLSCDYDYYCEMANANAKDPSGEVKKCSQPKKGGNKSKYRSKTHHMNKKKARKKARKKTRKKARKKTRKKTKHRKK